MSYSGKDVDDLYDILSLSPGVKGNEAQPGSFMPDNPQYDNIYTNFPFNQNQNNQNQNNQNNQNNQGIQGNNQINLNQNQNPNQDLADLANAKSKSANLSVNTTTKTPITNTTPSPSNELLSPTNFSSYSNNTSSNNNNTGSSYLYPRSPSVYSSHSLYSDASSNPASPYLDASSQISHSHNPPSNYSQPQSAQLSGLQYLDTDASNMLNNFDTEIALGGSISSTNLVGLDQVPQFAVNDRQQPPPQNLPQFNYSVNNQPMSLDFNMAYDDKANAQLTENNLINYNNSMLEQPMISVHQAPQDVAAKTPSLFSNSSANSSIHNSPAKGAAELSKQNTGNSPAQKYSGVNSLVPNSHLVYGNGSASSSSHDLVNKEEDGLLKVDEFKLMRRGRRRSHSERSRSRSRSKSNVSEEEFSEDYDDEEEDDDNSDKPSTWRGVSSREKMLELASPSQPAKRTQKHPSVYSCHLCEKRFTRPYNLKSHLRTHTDERPFICNVCGKAFARQHDRKRHEELHTGEKKFQCKGFLKDGSPYGCGRKFARADALRRHFQTENGKACIRLLIEEEELERQRNGGIGPPVTAASVSLGQEDDNGYLSPTSAMLNSLGSSQSIPQVAISPPD